MSDNKEKLKEKITKKLTDMGFDSFDCILTTNAKEGYIKIIYPELGLCFFKEYDMTYSPFFGPSIDDIFNKFFKDVKDIKRLNKTRKLRTLHKSKFIEYDKYEM